MMHGKMKIFCNFLIYLLNKPYSLQDHVIKKYQYQLITSIKKAKEKNIYSLYLILEICHTSFIHLPQKKNNVSSKQMSLIVFSCRAFYLCVFDHLQPLLFHMFLLKANEKCSKPVF